MIQEIARYWDKQSAIWSEEKKEAWAQPETTYWGNYFRQLLPQLTGNKALEVGTASGYFAHIMALARYQVTAIDVSPNMISEAEAIGKTLGVQATYQVMDAQVLQFPDNHFDLIFTRLMTWTTPDVAAFYKECFRVLKPGGTLRNFDGDFGNYTFTREGHEKYPAEIMEQANRIKSQLDISRHKRPERDITLLQQAGFVHIAADLRAEATLLQRPGNESSLFQISAQKP